MKANQGHMKVMKKMMTFCVNTKEYGIFIDPDGEWKEKTNNNQQFDFVVEPMSQQYAMSHI
jgi:hypothetical protein